MEIRKNNALGYILLCLCWTYLFWLTAAIISHNYPNWQGIFILHLLGGIGPLVASIFVVTKTGRWHQYFARIVKVKDFSPYLWILILSPILIAAIISLILYGNILVSQKFMSSGIIYAILLLFFGPIPEELGWRGVLFDELSKHSLIKAQVITTCIWLIWHIPLFFIVGSYQYGVGFATYGFLIWCIGLILQSIIMGCLYLLTKRSIASAILFHYFVNLAGEFIEKNVQFESLSLLFYGILATVTILAYKTMTRQWKISNAIK